MRIEFVFSEFFDDVDLFGEVMNLMSLDASFSPDYESMFRLSIWSFLSLTLTKILFVWFSSDSHENLMRMFRFS